MCVTAATLNLHHEDLHLFAAALATLARRFGTAAATAADALASAAASAAPPAPAHAHTATLRALFARGKAKGRQQGPLAYGPPDLSSTYAFTASRPHCHGSDARAVDFQCLQQRYTVRLVEHAQQLAPSVAALLQAASLSSPPTLAFDGEFESVLPTGSSSSSSSGAGTGRRRFSQRMALLTLLAPAASELYAFHLPSLLRPFQGADMRYRVGSSSSGEAAAGVAALLALLQTTRLVSWSGTSNDVPALQFALPGAALPLHFDLQGEYARSAPRGALPEDPPLPLGLHAASVREFGAGLDKNYQLALWGEAPTAEMLAYAAADVVVTLALYQRFQATGSLFRGSEEGTVFE